METRELLSPRGVPVATYVHAERDGLPYVHQLVPRPGVATDAVARAAAERLAGLLVDTELPGLRESLEAAGAQVRHRAELMQVSLAGAEGRIRGLSHRIRPLACPRASRSADSGARSHPSSAR